MARFLTRRLIQGHQLHLIARKKKKGSRLIKRVPQVLLTGKVFLVSFFFFIIYDKVLWEGGETLFLNV